MKICQMMMTGLLTALLLGSCSDDAKGNSADDADGAVTQTGGNSNGTDGTGSNTGNTTDDSTDFEVGFPGDGNSGSGEALEPGISPETADECNANTTIDIVPVVIDQEVTCFYGEGKPDVPAAAIEQVVEVVEDREWVHLRLTLDPAFVDNSYGETAIGWEDGKKPGHTFKDLVGSDHAEMLMYAADGNLSLHFKLDYISADPDSPSGYSTLGVSGGDGNMLVGDAGAILGAATSLNRNLNGCGLEYVVDSPATDNQYTPAAGAENWDYRVVYEVWVDNGAFGSAGFGEAIIEHVHASPAKQKENTILVEPGECPECDPSVEDCDPWEECDPTVEDCGEDDTVDSDTFNGDTDTHVTDTADDDTEVHVE